MIVMERISLISTCIISPLIRKIGSLPADQQSFPAIYGDRIVWSE